MVKEQLKQYQLPETLCLANSGEENNYCLAFRQAMENKNMTESEIEKAICSECIFYCGNIKG